MYPSTERDYEKAIENVDALSDVEKNTLKQYLFAMSDVRELNGKEKFALLQVMVDHTARLAPFSDRREDWYGEDRR